MKLPVPTVCLVIVKSPIPAIKRHIEAHHHVHHCCGYGLHALAGLLEGSKAMGWTMAAFPVETVAASLVAVGGVQLFMVALFDSVAD